MKQVSIHPTVTGGEDLRVTKVDKLVQTTSKIEYAVVIILVILISWTVLRLL